MNNRQGIIDAMYRKFLDNKLESTLKAYNSNEFNKLLLSLCGIKRTDETNMKTFISLVLLNSTMFRDFYNERVDSIDTKVIKAIFIPVSIPYLTQLTKKQLVVIYKFIIGIDPISSFGKEDIIMVISRFFVNIERN